MSETEQAFHPKITIEFESQGSAMFSIQYTEGINMSMIAAVAEFLRVQSELLHVQHLHREEQLTKRLVIATPVGKA